MLLLDASGNVLRSGAPVRSRDETTSELTGGREYPQFATRRHPSPKRILNSPNRRSFNPRPIFIHRCSVLVNITENYAEILKSGGGVLSKRPGKAEGAPQNNAYSNMDGSIRQRVT